MEGLGVIFDGVLVQAGELERQMPRRIGGSDAGSGEQDGSDVKG